MQLKNDLMAEPNWFANNGTNSMHFNDFVDEFFLKNKKKGMSFESTFS